MSGIKQEIIEDTEFVDPNELGASSPCFDSQQEIKTERFLSEDPIQLLNGPLVPINESPLFYFVIPNGESQILPDISNLQGLVVMPPFGIEPNTFTAEEVKVELGSCNVEGTHGQNISSEIIQSLPTSSMLRSQVRIEPSTVVSKSVKLEHYTSYDGVTSKSYDHIVGNNNTVNNKPFKFKCDYPSCMQTFVTLYEKKEHVDSHILKSNDKFKCNICNMLFEEATTRNKHVETHSIVSNYKCKKCDSNFPYYTTLVTHITDGKCNSRFEYSKPSKPSFKSLLSIKSTTQTLVKSKSTYKLKIQAKFDSLLKSRIPSKSECVRKPLIITHETARSQYIKHSFTCTKCGAEFANALDLAKHQNEKVSLCTCGAGLCNEESLEFHKNMCVFESKKYKQTFQME